MEKKVKCVVPNQMFDSLLRAPNMMEFYLVKLEQLVVVYGTEVQCGVSSVWESVCTELRFRYSKGMPVKCIVIQCCAVCTLK